MSEIVAVKLSNGVEMPVFGLGTWQNKPEENVTQTIKDAIDASYRLFDCVHFSLNEQEVGHAFQEKIHQKIIKREDLFIVSRIKQKPDLDETQILETLKNLQTTYIDLYLLDQSTFSSNTDYIKAWKVMEKIYSENFARGIGLSNFNSQQIEIILQNSRVSPHVNRVECHPFFNQKSLRKFCENHYVIIMGYSILGQHKKASDNLDILNENRIREIADRYKKTPAQILLKYNLQLGNVVISKTSNKKRLQENINIFNFYLAPEDMSYINSFQSN